MMNRFIKHKTLYLFATVLALSISSCRSYKELAEVPAPDSKGIVRDTLGNGQDTTSVADMSWKEYFSDAKLQQLIEEGLNNNLNLKIAMQSIE